MTLYRVRISIPDVEMELEATSEDFAVYRALGLFWVDPSAYVDIDPAEVEVDEVME